MSKKWTKWTPGTGVSGPGWPGGGQTPTLHTLPCIITTWLMTYANDVWSTPTKSMTADLVVVSILDESLIL